MLATKENIVNYIPQSHPMVLIHDLVEVSNNHAVTQLSVDKENIFLDDDHLSEPGLIENIAQTAAVQIGYQCFVRNIPVPIGYIAAVKSLKINRMPRIGERITTTVNIRNKVLDVTMAEGKTEVNGQLYCSCEMRIFAKVQL